MRLFRRREPEPFVPTRPGASKGIRPGRPGFIDHYYDCGHVVSLPSNVRDPDACPHAEHEGWQG